MFRIGKTHHTRKRPAVGILFPLCVRLALSFMLLLSIVGRSGTVLAETPDWSNTYNGTNVGDLGTGDSLDGSIDPAGDLDYFKFTATGSVTYTIATSNLGSGMDSVISLYDTGGTSQLAQNDDCIGFGLASCINWTAPTSGGTYYVRVKHYTTVAIGIGTYTITVSQTPAPADDFGDSQNDTAPPPGILTLGTDTDGKIETPGDVDYFAFIVTNPGNIYTIETSNLGPGSDTLITLYDTNGTTRLAQNDDCGSLASCINWIAIAGTYYVRVQHYNTGGTGTYTIKVTDTGSGPPADDFGDSWNDTSPSPGILTLGTGTNGKIETPGDVDYFAFIVTNPGNIYTIETSNLGPGSDTLITLYDTNGTTQLAQNDDCGSLASCINWIAITGTYYVRVKHYNSNNGTGSYTITVTDTMVVPTSITDDWSDTYDGSDGDAVGDLTPAKDLVSCDPIPVQKSGDINPVGDWDYFKFTTDPSTIYVITTSELGFGSDTVIKLDPLSGPLVENDDCPGFGLASCITFNNTNYGANYGAGDYYVKVEHFGGSSGGAGTYTITATFDEPVAFDDVYSIDEDNTLNGNVVDNDSVIIECSDVVLVSGVSNGTLLLYSDDSFSYNPNSNYYGSDSFQYKVNDGLEESNTRTVTITVNPVNDPPVANADSATTSINTAVIIAVLTNDSDVEDGTPDPSTVTVVSSPSNGTTSVNTGTGEITYTPSTGFTGADSFTYNVKDYNDATSNNATVTVTVNP